MSTTLAPIEPDAATGEAAELLGQVKKSLGLVPAMAKVMANTEYCLSAHTYIGANPPASSRAGF